MSKNEIGKYVRTEYGYILENTLEGHENIIEELANKDSYFKFKYGKIIKHSEKLIEILEKRRLRKWH